MSSLPEPATPRVLYLVDLSGYVFRAYHAIAPLTSSKGEPTHAVLGTVNMLQKIVNVRKPHMFAVAMDAPGRSFRKEIDDRYKATRPAAPIDLKHQMKRVREVTVAYNIPVFEEEGLEADDLIATVTKEATKQGIKVVIVSADKDLMQLVHDEDEDVVLWDTMRDKVYGPPEVKEKFGVMPSQLRSLLAFTGDTSDNIPGVPGVGPKTASDLINAYGSIDGVYASIDSVKKGKMKENLIAHEADARLSYQLVGLKEDARIKFDEEQLVYGGADIAELKRLFTDLEFFRFLNDRSDMRESMNARKGAASGGTGSSPPPSGGSASESRAPVALAKPEPLVERGALDAFVVEAQKQEELGIVVVPSGDDPMTSHVIGVCLYNGKKAVYVPITHRYLGAPQQLAWHEVIHALAPIFSDGKTRVSTPSVKLLQTLAAREGVEVRTATGLSLAEYLLDPEAPHTFADLVQREFGVTLDAPEGKPKKGQRVVPFDERDLDEATEKMGARAEYAARIGARVRDRLASEGMGSLYDDLELPLSWVLSEVERTGVLVDAAMLGEASLKVEAELAKLDAKAQEIVGHDFGIRSRDQLEQVLFDDLKLRVVKRTPKGGRSTDAEVLEELSEEHPLPKVILEFRELDKLKGTYLDALPRAIHPETGRIHTRFEQDVAATGRLSSVAPNLQNIPIRTAVGREIRRAFVAAPGHVLVSADYSQIELRVLAHLSKDPLLLEGFAANTDVHVYTASVVFGVPIGEVTKDQRNKAKTVNFGVIYGMGEAALARRLDIPRMEARQFIAAYFDRYKQVRRFLDETVHNARAGEAVRTMLGRRRFLPNLHSANRGLRMEAERIATNTPIQGTAADILKLAMVKLGRDDPPQGGKMILTVHDELLFEVERGAAEAAMQHVKHAMENVVKLEVPLVVDAGFGPTWADAH